MSARGNQRAQITPGNLCHGPPKAQREARTMRERPTACLDGPYGWRGLIWHMCGRDRLTRSLKQLEENFNATGEVEMFPRYPARRRSGNRPCVRSASDREVRREREGASIVPIKDRIEWPYLALLVRWPRRGWSGSRYPPCPSLFKGGYRPS